MSFIGLKTPEGKWLDLGNSEIEFEIESPVFTWKYIPGEKTYLFKIPSSKTNRRIIGYPNRVANSQIFNKRQEGFELWFGGLQYGKGNLYVKKVNNSFIECSFQTAASRLTKYKDYSIQSFNLGNYVLPALSGSTLNNFMLLNVANPSSGIYPDYMFAPIRNANAPNNYINRWNTAYGFNITVDDPIVPFMFLKPVLEKLFAYSNIKPIGSFFDDDELGLLCFYSSKKISSLSWSASNYLPDITYSELLQSLAKLFGIAYFVNRTDDVIEFKFLKDILGNYSFKDITDVVNPKIDIEFTNEKGVFLKQEVDSGDELSKDDNLTYSFFDEPYISIETLFSHINDNKVFNISNLDFLIPEVEQKIDDTLESSSFSPRLMFYREMQDAYDLGFSAYTNPYPLVSFEDKKLYNTEIPGTKYTLNWDGSKGLSNVFWKSYISFISKTKLITTTVQFGIEEIVNFDFSQKLRIKSNLYLPNKLKFKVNRNGVVYTELELFLDS